MSTTIDPAIRVKPSKELVAYIEAVDVKPESLKNINVDSQIELSDIKWIFETQLAHPNECPSFHELLQGSSVLLPKPEFPPRNPELDARIQKLKAQQEHREYNEMVSNVDGSSLKAQKDLSDIPISQQGS